MINGVATLGVLMLLLLTGIETDLKLVRKIGRPAIIVSAAGIVVPFLCGVALGEALPDAVLPNPGQRLITALFLGTALSISSVKIVAMLVRDLGFQRRNIGQIILAAAILDDTIAWVLIAIIASLAAGGTIDLSGITRSVLGTALFLAVSFTIGRRIVFRLIRWTNDNFISDMPVITVILLIMGAMALATDAIGVHTVLGAFVAGMLVGNSPILTRQIDGQLRGLITGLFMPVFFGLSGLRADLGVLADPHLLLLAIGLVLIASVGKFAGAFLGGRLAGLTMRECLTLGCGMNARGSTEVIVATIGLSVGALDQRLYTIIVAMALITTLAMPPMLRWALARLPFSEEEKERLAREAFAEKSFVAKLERLLIAVDESENGRFASRLAGLIAGGRGLPATVLPLHATTPAGQPASQAAEGPDDDTGQLAVETLKAAAEVSKAAEAESADEKPAPVDVIIRTRQAPIEDAVAGEAARGYDLLVAGVENAVLAHGHFNAEIARTAEAFEGPLAIADARGTHLENPFEPGLDILVPVTGTEVSRRALEIALCLARSSDGGVTALYVSGNPSARRRIGFGRSLLAMENEEAILREAVTLADQYGTLIRTAMSSRMAPAEAIIRRAHSRRYDLVVMGVRKRPGQTLFFGNVAAAVIEKSKRSLLFVAS
jgi:Kef-type K+ transport system membrane component KefB/nucleotide-binding universal stress UspA family protein